MSAAGPEAPPSVQDPGVRGRPAGGDAGEPVDRPLSGRPYPHDKLHPSLYAAEAVGTALLVVLGLSSAIALWGLGSPVVGLPLAPGLRRLLDGFVFGSVGAAIACSPLGRVSGAHVDPAMTLAFLLADRLRWRDAGCYVLAQLFDAAAGAALLVAWGASVPAAGAGLLWPVLGEVTCTFLLVALVFFSASRPATQPFTPLINPPPFAVLSWLEAPPSGASANSARSFGPERVGHAWAGWWVYRLGPRSGRPWRSGTPCCGCGAPARTAARPTRSTAPPSTRASSRASPSRLILRVVDVPAAGLGGVEAKAKGYLDSLSYAVLESATLAQSLAEDAGRVIGGLSA